MKKLRLGFTDTFGAIEEFFTELLSREYEIERDDVNPGCLIFGDKNFGNNNIAYNNRNCVKIFYTGENQRASDYECHYAITFDHIEDEYNYRLPLYVIYDWDNKRKKVAHSKDCTRHIEDLSSPRKFCSFVVKNSGCTKRNAFFHRLNAYSRVDSAGPLFNNVGEVLARGDQSVQSKLAFLPKYKFNLCFENASYPGYATEKVYEALIAKTVPIYWGSPTIELDFNTEAMLNWHDYGDDDKFFEAIKQANENEIIYSRYYLQPIFAKQNRYMDLNRFLFWFSKNVYKG